MDFKEFKEHGLESGFGTILAYKLSNENKYHIVCALTTIPSISGSKNTIGYSTTSNNSVTKVPGKKTINDVEITFPYNADTVTIMNKLADQDIQYAIINLENGLGWKFVANASYRMNDISPDNVNEGTLQLVISSVEDAASDNMLDVYMDTVTFGDGIPNRVSLVGAGTKVINVVTDPTDATLTVESDSDSVCTIANADGVVTITAVAQGSTYVYIKAVKAGIAGNERKIYVVVE